MSTLILLDQTVHRPQTLRDIHADLAIFELIEAAIHNIPLEERGFNEVADIITATSDGIDLNTLWREFRTAVGILNRDRTTWINRLTFRVTNPVERVSVPAGSVDFELASEYGVPKGIRAGTTTKAMGYPFEWYDLAARYTWQFLAENTSEQVRSLTALVLEASIRLQFNLVWKTVFNSTNGIATIDDNPYNVYKFYNADGDIPPAYKTTTFDGTHTHYLASGATTVDSGDLEDIEEHLLHHGYTMDRGYTHVLWANKQEGAVIRALRVATGSKYDFIPADNKSFGGGVYLENDPRTIVGRPTVLNLPGVIGTWGPFVIVEDEYIPAGFLFGQAFGGEQNIGNPIGIREHETAALRGLRLVKGAEPDYPLIDSYYVQGLGTGVRHRGAGVVMKITAGSYAPPPAYA